MFMSADVTKQPQIEAFKEIVNVASAHVVDISFEFGKDWTRDWAIFFQVLLGIRR
jgi:hypothetical protein